MSTETDDFMQEGGTSFSFDGVPPISVKGTVQVDAPVKMQQKDYDTGAPLTWDDGNPKWQWRVDLQTDLRTDAGDDGLRSVYLKARSKSAVVAAVKAAGAKRLERGGTLELAYVSDDHSDPHRPTVTCTPDCEKGKGYPAKIYKATYSPADGFMGSDSATPTPSGNSVSNGASDVDEKLKKAGIPEGRIASMDVATKKLLLANMGA